MLNILNTELTGLVCKMRNDLHGYKEGEVIALMQQDASCINT